MLLGSAGRPRSAPRWFLKAGASTQEPRVSLSSDNRYQVNIDKGEQSEGGADAAVLGNIDNGLRCDDGRWVKASRSSSTGLTVQADSGGYLWLHAGTDSGFEGLIRLYYSAISVTLTPALIRLWHVRPGR